MCVCERGRERERNRQKKERKNDHTGEGKSMGRNLNAYIELVTLNSSTTRKTRQLDEK